MAEIKIEVTNVGMALLVKALEGIEPINFVGMQFGNGSEPDDTKAVTALQNPIMSRGISEWERGDNFVALTSVFSNADVSADFILSEIGLFAKTQDDEEVLFGYVFQGDSSEVVLSADSNKIQENKITVIVIVDNDAQVTAVTSSQIYTTKEEFQQHLEDNSNPHKVTASQVGLDRVENVPAREAVILFEEDESDEYPKSGDMLSAIIGKILHKLKLLFDHVTNKSNPHGVTASQISAAAAKHNHQTSDIISGTFNVARGGTGVSAWTAGRILYAQGATTLSQIAHPSEEAVLAQKATGAPYFIALSALELFHAGTTEPERKNVLWIDTTPTTGGLKYYDNGQWRSVPVRYTTN